MILWLVAVIGMAAGVYLVGNGRVALWDRDKPRYAMASRWMDRSGDWVVPRVGWGWEPRTPRTAKPEICNSDQGSQFTSGPFTEVLKGRDIRISMDGRGQAYDNIFTERLWRSVKYEEVYLRDYQTPGEANTGLGTYFGFYNWERPHQSLDGWTPAERHGLRPGPWPVQAKDIEGVAAASAASPLALRAHDEAAEEAEASLP